MGSYILAVTVAAVIQILTIYLLRENIIKSLFYAIPLIIIFQLLFLWSYTNAPKFIIIWFITAAITSSLSFVAGYFLWKEQVSITQLIGIALIVMGIFLLRIKIPT